MIKCRAAVLKRDRRPSYFVTYILRKSGQPVMLRAGLPYSDSVSLWSVPG